MRDRHVFDDDQQQGLPSGHGWISPLCWQTPTNVIISPVDRSPPRLNNECQVPLCMATENESLSSHLGTDFHAEIGNAWLFLRFFLSAEVKRNDDGHLHWNAWQTESGRSRRRSNILFLAAAFLFFQQVWHSKEGKEIGNDVCLFLLLPFFSGLSMMWANRQNWRYPPLRVHFATASALTFKCIKIDVLFQCLQHYKETL